MSEVTRNSLKKILLQLKCHFTWNLFKEGTISSYIEDRVRNQIEFLNSEYKATMYNLLAYIKHLDGENEAALECLRQAEDLLKPQQDDQAEIRLLVTWGNYAWVYYYMGQFSEAQAYADKVRHVCMNFANPYSMECPELDCEEGWTRLKCGKNERAKICFEKALEEKPNDPECSCGLAIATYHLEENPEKQVSVDALKQAMDLNSKNQYIKVLLALKMQRMGEEAEGEQLIEDALREAPNQTDVLQKAGQFYKKKSNFDRANEFFVRALESTANNSPFYCSLMCYYRKKLEHLQSTGAAETSESRDLEELRRLLREYMDQALQRKRSPLNSYSDLSDFPEIERCYQLVFSKESPDAEEQQLYQRYCDLLEYHRKSEDLAALKAFLQLQRNGKCTEKEDMEPQA